MVLTKKTAFRYHQVVAGVLKKMKLAMKWQRIMVMENYAKFRRYMLMNYLSKLIKKTNKYPLFGILNRFNLPNIMLKYLATLCCFKQ